MLAHAAIDADAQLLAQAQHEIPHVLVALQIALLDLVERFQGAAGRALAAPCIEQAPGLADGVDRFGREAPAPQALLVHAAHGLLIPDDFHVRRHVVRDARHAADVGIAAHGHEIVHARRPADVHAILDADVPGKLHLVGEDDVVAELDVVGHVDAHHEQVAIADARPTAAAPIDLGAAMNGDELAKRVARADFDAGRAVLVLEILRRGADHALREKDVARADAARPQHRHMAHQLATVRQNHPRADVAERTNAHVAVQLGRGIDNSARMDLAHRGIHPGCASTSMKRIDASATGSRPTRAWHATCPMFPRTRTASASSRS